MLVFGHTITELAVVDSTNTFLIEKSRVEKCFEGEVVLANFQTEGRGQRDAVWESLPGENLMCSIFALPTFLTGDNFFLLSKIIAIAVQKVVASICLNCKVEVKWPNDIYVNRKKIGGILIENQFKGSAIKQSVIGLGLNINQTNFENNKATSLKLETKDTFIVETILTQILQQLEIYYFDLKWGKQNYIATDYLKALMNYNTLATYKIEGTLFSGIIKNVLNNGMIEIETEGSLKQFRFKEIEFII